MAFIVRMNLSYYSSALEVSRRSTFARFFANGVEVTESALPSEFGPSFEDVARVPLRVGDTRLVIFQESC
jgi:hypothetical protein